MVWLYALVSVVIVSLVSLIGIFTLALREERLRKLSLYLVSFAVGGLFGDAIIHLLPETFKRIPNSLLASLLIVAGILVFFILERFLRWRHCHETDCPEHQLKTVAAINLIGDAAHNLIDGMVIAASYLISPALGIATTLAVFSHEIPHEIGNFGILIHSGFTIKRALLFNFMTALAAIVGTIFTLIVGSRLQTVSVLLLPITAGGFLYVAGSDLLPELHHDVSPKTSFWQMLLILLGVGIMASLVILG